MIDISVSDDEAKAPAPEPMEEDAPEPMETELSDDPIEDSEEDVVAAPAEDNTSLGDDDERLPGRRSAARGAGARLPMVAGESIT